MNRLLTTTTAAVALVLLAACGGDDDAGGAETSSAETSDAETSGAETSGGGAVTVIAEDIDFGADAYEAEAGTVDFEYVNEGDLVHSLVIEDVDGFRLLVESGGDTDEGSVELEAGSYRLVCDIPGHEQAGMVADLEVS